MAKTSGKQKTGNCKNGDKLPLGDDCGCFRYFKHLKEADILCITGCESDRASIPCLGKTVTPLVLTASQDPSEGIISVSPRNLVGLKDAVDRFLSQHPDAVVFLANFDILYEYHGWSDLREFISQLNSMVDGHTSRLIIRTDEEVFPANVVESMKEIVSDIYIQPMSAALASPMRRSVIRCLKNADGVSFSTIMRYLDMEDSPRLSFHLRKLMGDRLIRKDASKTYYLTDRGENLYKLIKQMESVVLDDPDKSVELAS